METVTIDNITMNKKLSDLYKLLPVYSYCDSEVEQALGPCEPYEKVMILQQRKCLFYYFGQWADRKESENSHGRGVAIYESSLFEGYFKDAGTHKGRELWDNGDMYHGEYRGDNKREGKGKYTYAGGDIYIGDWVANLKEGQGIYYFTDGSKYSGAWKADKQHGTGIYTYKEGVATTSEWVNGTEVEQKSKDSRQVR